MRKIIGLLGATGVLVALAVAENQKASKTEDEQALRKMESGTASFERQNDASNMGALADDWVCVGPKKILSKAEFQENVQRN